MKVGRIQIVIQPEGSSSKRTMVYGDADSDMRANIRVLKDTFWPRLMVYSALGFGEAYMYGEIEVDNLATLLLIFIKNREHFSDMNLLPAGLNKLINAALHSHIPNTIYNSLYNIQAHYDLGNEMFAAFLDPTMTYSCPIWADENDDDLEGAQYRKIHAILERAKIRKGDHVLEIGTGWGALSIEAVKLYDCTVTTLTLSKEQKLLAEERIAKAGYSSKITVLLCDYRNLDPTQHQFDRIVTVEMLEAVGPEFLPVFFKQAHALLKPRGKHIFPGGHCPSVTALVDAVYKGTKGKLIVDEIVNIGPHYAKALRIWRERFVDGFDGVRKETGLDEVYTEEFKRKWEFYFAYCEAGFASRTLGDIHMRLTREANFDLLEGIPF
ncbi:hypothetical protein HDU76_008467 [Blyttiomyces sp. JEL0837]|nr:hypothetical protein HDU76_008467 [Blyttiomyces sp. JEL0837]